MERVVNGFIVVFFLTGFFWQMGANGIAGTLSGGLGLLLPCVLLFPLFYFRMLGAGDIKLFSGLGIFLGVTAVFKLILCSSFSGRTFIFRISDFLWKFQRAIFLFFQLCL